MKVKLIGIVIILTALTMTAVPVWGQETAQSEEPTVTSQEEATPAAADDEASTVQIEDAVVCQDIVDRTPVGSNDMFVRETEKIYCFCRVVGAETGTQITHNWYYNGSLKASVKLNVGSSNFRTWSSKTLSPELQGEWMVEILSDDGKPLESIVFVIQ